MKHPVVEMSARGWVELGLLSALWGGTFFSVAIALRELGPLTSVLHRVGWAALALWLVVLVRGVSVPTDLRIWAAFLVMGLLNNVIPFTLMSWGQLHVESGLVSIFNAMTAPLGVVVAAMILPDEPLSRRRGTGVVIAFLGTCLIIGVDGLNAFEPQALAQWAVLAGALSYAFASVWAKLRLRAIDPMVAAAGMLTGSTAVMVPIAVGVEGSPAVRLAPATWLAIGYYAIFATACAYLLYYRVLAMAGAGNLMLCTLLIPPTAISLGWAFLAEDLENSALIGFGLIGLGLIVIDGRLLRMRIGGQPVQRE